MSAPKRMNPKIKKKWLKALRSGEYKQTKGRLRKGEGFCCLGVLCNLHAQAHPEIAAQQKYKKYYMWHSDLLPHEVQEWAGLSSDSGEYTPNNSQYATSLAEKNDAGAKFSELADIIEEYF